MGRSDPITFDELFLMRYVFLVELSRQFPTPLWVGAWGCDSQGLPQIKLLQAFLAASRGTAASVLC